MDRWVPQGLVEFLWTAFLSEVIDVHAIDAVMLSGACRAYHRIAHKIAKERKLEAGVFEEDDIRPDCITLERDGVNGNSTLPDNPIFYLNKVPSGEISTEPVGNTFWLAALWAAFTTLRRKYWAGFFRYRHHRPLSLLEGGPWLRSIWRKAFCRGKERNMQFRLTAAFQSLFPGAPAGS
jgi:capsular polysaccharide export protein